MDKLDALLLDELEQNGYRNAEDLAKKFDVSKRTIYRHIHNLRRNRIFEVIAIPNPRVFGYEAWAEICIKVKPRYLKNVIRQLVESPLTYSVTTTIGEFDILVDVLFENTEKLASFVNLELTAINGVVKTETILLKRPIKYYHLFRSNFHMDGNAVAKQRHRSNSSQNMYKPEEIDLKILKFLRMDGLISPGKIKSKLGVAENTIRKHIKDMLANKVFSLEVITNPRLLHYEAWATIGINIDHRFVYESFENMVDHSAVYFAGMTLGRYNFILGVRFHNVEHLYKFAKIELPAIGGIVSVEILPYTRPLKYYGINWENDITVGDLHV